MYQVQQQHAGRVRLVAHGGRRATRSKAVPYILIAPFVAVALGFFLVPIGYAFWRSLFSQTIIGGAHFAGVLNYSTAFRDHLFLGGVEHVAVLAAIEIPILIGLALVLALLLDAGVAYFASILRVVIFLPYAVPSIIAGLMWGYLYSPSFGPVAQVAKAVGFSGLNPLAPRFVVADLCNVLTWEFTGYNMILIYSSLQGIPRELYEAARVDGAGFIRVALHIKVPLVASALVLATVFSIIGIFQLFNEPVVLNILAPGSVGASYTPNQYAYQLAFSYSEYDYAGAVSFILAAMVMAASYGFLFFARRRSALR